MFKPLYSMFFSLIILAGCGRIDQTATDNSTINVTPPAAVNCPSSTYLKTNGYGDCYDTDVLFPGRTGDLVVDSTKVWSVYMRSNTSDTDVFYDIYLRGYDFYGNAPGNVLKQEQTDGYTATEFWGIDDEGTKITTSEENDYTYTGEQFSDGCFKVTNGGKTLKLCHESLENLDANESNTTGLYFGSNAKFGNRTNYNFVVEGTWTIGGYGANNAATRTVVFASGGTTDTPGAWGVSADGKVIEFDGTRYQVYQYLSNSGCIAVLELSGGLSTGTQWKLCKQ